MERTKRLKINRTCYECLVTVQRVQKVEKAKDSHKNKRCRETGDSTEGSPRENNTHKQIKKKSKLMESEDSGNVTSNNPETEGKESTKIVHETVLSEEMKQMEKRMTANIMAHNKESMKLMIQETMKEILKPIQESTDNLLVFKTSMEAH